MKQIQIRKLKTIDVNSCAFAMTCAICRFYEVCVVRNTEEACTHREDRNKNLDILW